MPVPFPYPLATHKSLATHARALVHAFILAHGRLSAARGKQHDARKDRGQKAPKDLLKGLPNCPLAHRLYKIDKPKGLYKVLGVSHTARTKKIRSNYKKMALACHPDKNPADPKAGDYFSSIG